MQNRSKRYNSKSANLVTIFDLPARASIFEHAQWNDAFGCMDCQDVGKKVDGGFIWPYTFSASEKSTHLYINVYCHLKARRTGVKEPFMGVKSESVLTKFIDVAQQNPLDFMHQTYRGVVDRILNTILTPTSRGNQKPWNISNRRDDLKQLDSLQLQINLPQEFQRTLQSLDRWKQSKANEYKNMMLYTLVPCLKKILSSRGKDANDFWHWLLLYNDISRRLTQDEIIANDLAILERLIDSWQFLVSTFLGERNSTYNIHATRHMPKYVRLLGPVHNYSTFAFEGFMNFTFG